jgi:hypothetical protein
MKKIRITDIVVISRDIPFINNGAESYPDMTPEEAVAYELNRDEPEIIESIVSSLDEEEPMVFERTVKIVEVRDEMDEAVQLTLPNIEAAAKASGAAYGQHMAAQGHGELFGVNPITQQTMDPVRGMAIDEDTKAYDPIFDGHPAEVKKAPEINPKHPEGTTYSTF